MKLNPANSKVASHPRLDKRYLFGQAIDMHLVFQVFQAAVSTHRPFADGVDSRCGGRTHPLAGQRTVSWSALRGSRLIAVSARISNRILLDNALAQLEERPVVFCEVKTRRGSSFGSPAEAVTREKRERIRALAAKWLAANRGTAKELRFDVAAVTAREGAETEIEIIEGAF